MLSLFFYNYLFANVMDLCILSYCGICSLTYLRFNSQEEWTQGIRECVWSNAWELKLQIYIDSPISWGEMHYHAVPGVEYISLFGLNIHVTYISFSYIFEV